MMTSKSFPYCPFNSVHFLFLGSKAGGDEQPFPFVFAHGRLKEQTWGNAGPRLPITLTHNRNLPFSYR